MSKSVAPIDALPFLMEGQPPFLHPDPVLSPIVSVKQLAQN
jgi:hypothetical protein